MFREAFNKILGTGSFIKHFNIKAYYSITQNVQIIWKKIKSMLKYDKKEKIGGQYEEEIYYNNNNFND